MTPKNFFMIPAIISLIFLIGIVSATSIANSVTISLFYDSTTSDSLTITNGDSVGISISADSVFEDSMIIKLDLLNSNGNLVMNVLDTYTIFGSYAKHLMVGQAAYIDTGDYIIRAIVTGESGQSDTDTLSLRVLAQTPANRVPVITSTPVLQVNEGQNYNYQVRANDADGDALTYSLTQNPSWLSINSAGLITGTAPLVNSDTNFLITLRVSDGKGGIATQSYTLTVRDIPSDTTPPIITVVSPLNGQTYTSSNVLLEMTTNEDASSAWYVLDNGGDSQIDRIPDSYRHFRNSVSLGDGTHSIVFYVRDRSGNLGQTSVITFYVDTSVPDTTAPIITVISPVNNEWYNEGHVLFEISTNEDASNAWYRLNGGNNIPFNQVNSRYFALDVVLPNGAYSVVFYARDLAGNIGQSSAITFYMVLPPSNNAPVITSSPVTQINEGSNYIYQVIATDADNDALSYSLTQKPSWLSINSQGRITGIAPQVSSDANFPIIIRVSDGKDFTTQTYTLTVIDVTGPPTDTTAPVVIISSPTNGAIYTSHRTQIIFTATDANLDRCWYRLNNGPNVNTACNAPITGITSVQGTNTWIVYAIDTAGNQGSASITFNVNIPSGPGGKTGRNIGAREISDTQGTEQYLSQFTPKTITEEEEVLSLKKQPSLLSQTLWVWLLAVGILILIVALIILWGRR